LVVCGILWHPLLERGLQVLAHVAFTSRCRRRSAMLVASIHPFRCCDDFVVVLLSSFFSVFSQCSL
jgi:hypothetical protein